jgi:hypothetical protein
MVIDDPYEAYSSGLMEGAIYDPEGDEEISDSLYGEWYRVAQDFGVEGNGKGKLTCLWTEVWFADGSTRGISQSPSQPVGDCVSRNFSHALTLTLAAQVNNGIGSWPQIDAAAWKKCPMHVHPAPIYATRGHCGHGWSCSTAANNSKKIVALVVPGSYDGWDLTYYSSKTQTQYCRGIPGDVLKALDASNHLVREVSHVRSFEQVADALASGYGVSSCGGEGWSKNRNEHAVSRRSGRWSHALAVIGADDTEWAHQHYGGPLVCIANSWGAWNRGPRHTHGDVSLPEVPVGAFWTPWKDASARSFQVLSNVNGFPPRKIRDWNIVSGGLI